MRQAIKLAIEWIEKQPEETPHSKYDVDTRYVVLKELEAALAQPEQEPVGKNNLIPIDYFCKKSAKQINEQYKARQAFWNVALGNNSKLANLAKLAIDEVEKLVQDEVDIRSRLYQRIHELECLLKDIAEYTGEGPPTTDWQGIVKLISDSARNALEKNT